MLIINIGRSTVSSAVKIANHPNSVPEVSSFDALIPAVSVFPAKRMSSRWAAYPVPLESFLHIDLHSFCFADMVIFYFQCTLYLQNITFVRFLSKKISLCLVYRTMHSSFLFITCVRFRGKKILSAILLHSYKYYISKI